MGKITTDPALLKLTEQIVEMDRKLGTANSKIEEQKKEIDILYYTLTRPAVATITEAQIDLLARILIQKMEIILTDTKYLN